MNGTLPQKDVVLLGAGHAHLQVLRRWRRRPMGGARLTCVSDFPLACYCGMAAGALAGQYPPERMQIDLVRLCAAVGARLVCDSVEAVDVHRRELRLADRPPLPFDLLSIGVGSVPRGATVEEPDETLLALKPTQTFLSRLEARLARIAPLARGRPLRIVILGGDATGLEIAFCLPKRIAMVLGDAPVELAIVECGDQLGRRLAPAARRLAAREIEARGIRPVLGRFAQRVAGGQIELSDESVLPVDLVLLATRPAPPELLAQIDLPKDEHGFLLTRPTLQTLAEAPVFAAGDVGTIIGFPLARAGAYAVREGPILWENLDRYLRDEPLIEFEPRRAMLKLINTGDDRAILSYRGWALQGRWCWRLKDWIDRRFIDRHCGFTRADKAAAHPAPPMESRLGGGDSRRGAACRALRRLGVPPREHLVLDADETAASSAGGPVVVTTEFLPPPLDDPYLFGRVAARHAAGDLLARGGRPRAALALAVAPPDSTRRQEQLLYELFAGALRELDALGIALAGGRSVEGPNLLLGFTLLGDLAARKPRGQAGPRVGDQLVLTKPLGTGVLLTAARAARCSAAWHQALVAAMLHGDERAARLLDELSVSAVCRVAGLGLAGHLLEMLRDGGNAAQVRLAQVPLLPGVAELLGERSARPASWPFEREIHAPEAIRRQGAYAALFDPQTAGGLLISLPETNADDLLAQLAEQGDLPAAIIGQVIATGPRRLIVG